VTALALTGWALCLVLALAARRRRMFVADAEHELRGAVTALALGVEAHADHDSLMVDVDRARAGLRDLARAQRRAAGDSEAALARSRVAQVACNLVANALEHGGGEVTVRIEVCDSGSGFAERAAPRRPGRGRGLSIVRRAVRESGGAMSIASSERGSTVAVELP
jgi:signal transduction histidine kinase